MKKFKFELDTPLKVKQIKEKLKKQELRKAILNKNKEEKQLDILKSTAQKARKSINEMLNSSKKMRDIYFADMYLNNVKNLVKQQEAVLRKAQDVYELTKTSYIKKRKDKEILEKLEEKSFQRHSQEVNRKEQYISDELGSIAFERRERNVL